MSLLTLELAEACLAANDALIKGQQDDITALRQHVKLLRDAILQNRAAKSGWEVLESDARFKKVLDATKEQ